MNEIAVISGGTKGIGKALVRIFSEHEHLVITCSRNREELEKLKSEIDDQFGERRLEVMKADLSDKTDVSRFASFILSFGRPIDILINNAGVYEPGRIHEEREGKLEEMIRTNLYSAYHLTRALLPAMIKRKQGDIVNICSTASIVPYLDGGSYGISKFAMYGMSKILREDLKIYNIRVTSVLPGATLTASWEGANLPDSRFMKPEDVARTVYNAYSLSGQSVVEEILLRPLEGDI